MVPAAVTQRLRQSAAQARHRASRWCVADTLAAGRHLPACRRKVGKSCASRSVRCGATTSRALAALPRVSVGGRNGRAGFGYATSFGVLFALLYLATGNLVAVIVAHGAGNLLAATQWAPRIERARQAVRREAMFLG